MKIIKRNTDNTQWELIDESLRNQFICTNARFRHLTGPQINIDDRNGERLDTKFYELLKKDGHVFVVFIIDGWGFKDLRGKGREGLGFGSGKACPGCGSVDRIINRFEVVPKRPPIT